MAIYKRNTNVQSDMTTGFGTSSENSAGRFYNRRTGRANVVRKGISTLDRYSWYYTMLALPRLKFLMLLFSIYIFVNFIFAVIYYRIGIKYLAGLLQGT